MVLVTTNWRLWLAGMAVSLIIFAVVYFTVIQPDNNAAQQALKSGLQQSQQVINQTKKQLKASGATGQAQQQVNRAAKLTSCISAAGTDAGQIAGCQTKYGH